MVESSEYSLALTFVNHEEVRADIILAPELDGIIHHDDIADQLKGRAKKLKNKGGKTAVSILLCEEVFCIVKNHLKYY